ncbi:MAG: phenylalanine--tRNA ligase subunit beta [Sphingobacteriaceae bacterium]
MKISYNWLKQFIDTDKNAEEISQILTGIGLEVERLEKIQGIPGGLQGLRIGLVVGCEQHPNADRLRITRIDVGEGELLQVVCGAPNVAEGQKVIVAVTGTTVYPLKGEPFKIIKSKIRGEVSEGMICAEDEIGLGESHDGIMILSTDATVGQHAKDYFKLNDDYVYEIGLTPNRADAFSHLGTARDIAAYLKIAVHKPDVSAFKTQSESRSIKVLVEDEAACPRYSSVTVSGVQVKDSPDWLKEKLNVIGLRPINNVVDVTNYVLHELGQPLHAFDADAIRGGKVLIKKCVEGTPFTTLDKVELKLSANDLMICDTEGPMCIAGVYGGLGSGVGASTTNVFLESAYFNAVSVRKTAKKHGLKTDASFRFERGTDPEMTILALKRAALLIVEVGGGTISSSISDLYPTPISPYTVSLTYRNTDRLIGKQIDHEEIRSIITALDIKIESASALSLTLKVPTYRVDVTREVDVIEEILRIYGYNNVEIPTQIRASLNASVKPDKDAVQNQLSDFLSANGYHEIFSNSLTKLAYLTKPEEAVKILNPLSIDLDVMRQTLLFSGLEAIAYNQNRRNADLKLYEFGKTYSIIGGQYSEQQRFAFFISGNDAQEQWNQKPSAVSFFQLKAVVDALIKRLSVAELTIEEVNSGLIAYGLQYRKGSKILVQFGAVNKFALKQTDIDKEVFYADFDFDLIMMLIRKNKIVFADVPKFPAVRRDLSMLIDQRVTFDTLKRIAQKTERKLLKSVNVFDVYQGDKLPPEKKSYALSFVLQDEEKTLTEKAIDGIMQKLMFNLAKEAGAEIRK